jgi:glycosyltransferase involved in cell wall biosynthesis
VNARPLKSLIVEGWRFLPHSYAVVHQWQLLSLSRQKNIALKIRDMPFYHRRWPIKSGLFEESAEETLRSLECAAAGECADATLRITFPFDFSPSGSRKTAVFGTSENQIIQKTQVSDERIYQQLRSGRAPQDVTVVTPSHWSARGFYDCGFRTEQVLVIPHGVDIETFHPVADPVVRSRLRARLPVEGDAFVFLSIGAMTGNKGIDVLLRAFAEVCRRRPEARLVLKGTDALYNSKGFLGARMAELTSAERDRVRDRLIYFGGSLPHRTMARLYRAADVYVSPYRAEGFNMPVLEAAASGLPVICTRGGATEDFVTDDFTRKIDSTRVAVSVEDREATRLEPSLEHLTALMNSAIEDPAWRSRAAQAGPVHARSHYAWDLIVQKLVHELLE